jgi:hypothetical protein
MQIVDSPDRFTGKIEDDVAFGKTGELSRLGGHQIGYRCGARGSQFEPTRQPKIERHGLRGNAEPTTPHSSVAHDTGGDIGGRARGRPIMFLVGS